MESKMEYIWSHLSENAVDILCTDWGFPFYENEIMDKNDSYVWYSFAFPTKKEITKLDVELMLQCNMFGYDQHCHHLLIKDSNYFKHSPDTAKLKESLELFKEFAPASELLNKINKI